MRNVKMADGQNTSTAPKPGATPGGGEMTAEGYRARLAEQEAECKAELDRLGRIGREAAEARTLADVQVAVAKYPGVDRDAIPDIAAMVVGRVGFDEHLKPFVKGDNGRPVGMSLEDYIRVFLDQRPHFRRVASQGGPLLNSPAWDILQAVSDVDYDRKWQAADPEGNKRAWREYNAKVSKGGK